MLATQWLTNARNVMTRIEETQMDNIRKAAEIMAEQVRVFAGIRLECAECHNHPFESWSQDQFWGI